MLIYSIAGGVGRRFAHRDLDATNIPIADIPGTAFVGHLHLRAGSG